MPSSLSSTFSLPHPLSVHYYIASVQVDINLVKNFSMQYILVIPYFLHYIITPQNMTKTNKKLLRRKSSFHLQSKILSTKINPIRCNVAISGWQEKCPCPASSPRVSLCRVVLIVNCCIVHLCPASTASSSYCAQFILSSLLNPPAPSLV